MGDFDNEGAMMDVDETLMCKFIRIKCDHKKPSNLTRKGTFGTGNHLTNGRENLKGIRK